jgi:DNA polymerase III epsilon subunit-like protein
VLGTWTPSIDVMQIAAHKLMDKRGELLLPNFKLQTVCKEFGIEDTQWHDALADIKATIKLYKLLEKNNDGTSI